VLTGALLALLVVMVAFWGRSSGASTSLTTATVSNVRADLADAGCIFTADVKLESPWQQWAFARVKTEARKQFVSIMRNKRRYMVENPVERQALGAEMAVAINHLARCEIAERVDFPRFELF
jgi:hypothetical protein